LSQAQGYRFMVLNKLTTADLEPTLKIVVDLSPIQTLFRWLLPPL